MLSILRKMTDKKTQIISLTRTIEVIQDRATKLVGVIKSITTEKITSVEFEEKLIVVDDLRTQFQDARHKLFGLLKQEELSEINAQGEEIEDVLDESRFQIRRQLKLLNPTPSENVSVKPESFYVKAKLPDIPLPKFDGHYEN